MMKSITNATHVCYITEARLHLPICTSIDTVYRHFPVDKRDIWSKIWHTFGRHAPHRGNRQFSRVLWFLVTTGTGGSYHTRHTVPSRHTTKEASTRLWEVPYARENMDYAAFPWWNLTNSILDRISRFRSNSPGERACAWREYRSIIVTQRFAEVNS